MIEENYMVENIPIFYRGNQVEELRKLLKKMIEFKASGLFIMGGNYVWMSDNGVKRKITPRQLEVSECEGLLECAYNSNSGLSILRSKKPLNFAYQFEDEEGFVHRFRVNAVSSTNGGSPSLVITFRLIQTTPPDVKVLGIPDEIVEVCKKNTKGIIYVTGATGEGKSTTLASIIRNILEGEDANINMVDIGEPIEYIFDEINKPSSFVTPLNVGIDVNSFYDGVVNCMRMEPQIIQISESRDTDTIQASLDASKSGHAVFTTLHSPNVPETLRRIVNMFPIGARSSIQLDIVESTSAIISQKLLKTKDGKRTAVREFLVLTPEVKEMLWNSNNIGKTAIDVLQQYGYPMTRDIQRVFDEGLITQDLYDKMMFNYNQQIKVIKKDSEVIKNA